MPGLPIAPPQASTTAGQVDALALFMLLVSLLIAGGIFLSIVVFCVRYRRRPGKAERTDLDVTIEQAADAVEMIVRDGVHAAMGVYNAAISE